MFITLPATSSGRSTGCRTRKPTPSRISVVARRFSAAACLYAPGMRVAMSSRREDRQPGRDAEHPAGAEGEQTAGDRAADERGHDLLRGERAAVGGLEAGARDDVRHEAEPARSTNTSVTP